MYRKDCFVFWTTKNAIYFMINKNIMNILSKWAISQKANNNMSMIHYISKVFCWVFLVQNTQQYQKKYLWKFQMILTNIFRDILCRILQIGQIPYLREIGFKVWDVMWAHLKIYISSLQQIISKNVCCNLKWATCISFPLFLSILITPFFLPSTQHFSPQSHFVLFFIICLLHLRLSFREHSAWQYSPGLIPLFFRT